MTSNSDAPTRKKSREYDEALAKGVVHHSKEILGLAVIGFFVVFFYGVLTLIKDDTGANANKVLDHFVEHAITSINFGLITVAVLVLGISLVFHGAKAADFLQSYVVRPILNLFQHACALTLGAALGYLALMGIGIAPRQEYGGASAFVILVLITLTILVGVRTVLEVLGKDLVDKACAEVIARIYSKLIAPIDASHSAVTKCGNFVVTSIGMLLFVLASLQIPSDLKNTTKSQNPSNSTKCEAQPDKAK